MSVISQAFSDGAGCSSAGSTTPIYKVGSSTYTYQQLLDTFGVTDGINFIVDADNVSSCGEAPLSEATAAAGSDATVCYNSTHTLAATATNGTILWTTSGTGTFNNATLEDPVYTFSAADITAGSVTLTLTVTGGNTAVDNMVLTVDPEATANAGPDAMVCYNNTHTLAAAVADISLPAP